jgi:heme exporter protein CcmD
MMGEYGIFVWPCYGAVIILLGIYGFSSWKNKRTDVKKYNELKEKLSLNE